MTAEAVAATKVDPETLSLRARPQRPIRFKRGLIVVLVALAITCIALIGWMALSPRRALHALNRDDAPPPDARASTDTLAGLPASYGDVPKLGPPLPGDLGRSILEHEQQSDLALDAGATQRDAQNKAAEQQRRAAEIKSARESGVLVQGHQGAPAEQSASAGSAAGATVAAPASEPVKLTLDPTRDPNDQGHKADFVNALDPRGDINPHQLSPLSSPNTLSAGSVISASLITGLRSDVPGLVAAQVTERVYDSATGRILLIPQGARLIGTYDSVVAFGQKRALVVWQRLIMPDGSSLRIDNVPATDPSGYSGLQDKVDFHTWALLKGVALSTLLGVSSELAFSGTSDLVQALRESTQDSVARAGDLITQRNLDIQPTITIRPGAPVRLVVHKDLILKPWQSQEETR